MKLIWPVPEGDSQASHRVADMPLTLAGAVIGFLDNSKANCKLLFDTWATRLKEDFGPTSVVYTKKPSMSRGLTSENQAAVGAARVVITGVGDCGSCTSWSIRDAVGFEKARIPTVTVLTEPFMGLGRVQATGDEYPGLRLMTLPHPFKFLSDDEVQTLADTHYGELIALLTNR